MQNLIEKIERQQRSRATLASNPMTGSLAQRRAMIALADKNIARFERQLGEVIVTAIYEDAEIGAGEGYYRNARAQAIAQACEFYGDIASELTFVTVAA